MTQLRWLAAGCLLLGVWLMATVLVYVDVLGYAWHCWRYCSERSTSDPGDEPSLFCGARR